MKISEVKTHYILKRDDRGALPWSEGLLLVSVITSDGQIGYGETITTFRAATVRTAVERLAKYYMGKDPEAPRKVLSEVQKQDYYYFQSFETASAASGLDIALWDICGKIHSAPIHRLLGGAVRDSVELYANGWYSGCTTPEDYAERARLVASKGYRAMKFDPFGSAFDTISDEELDAALSVLKAVRDAVGDRVRILVEHHGRFSLSSAVRIARKIASIDPYFVEEPTHQFNVETVRQYRNETRGLVKLALGERLISPEQAVDFITGGTVDFIQPDVCNIGGITGAWETALLARKNGVIPTLHNAHGPLQNAATLQVDALLPPESPQESFYEFLQEWKRELVGGAMFPEGGRVKVPSGPGLGISVNEKMLEELEAEISDTWPDAPIIWAVKGTAPQLKQG